MTKTQSIGALFDQDSIELLEQSFLKIQNCLTQLDDQQVWWRPSESLNSIGNLLLHISGNLRQWTLSGIGGLPDDREREKEFLPDVQMTCEELLRFTEVSILQSKECLQQWSDEHLLARYSIQGFSVSGLQAINHTVTHFVGHTHQIILLTRQMLGEQYRFAWSPDNCRDQLPI